MPSTLAFAPTPDDLAEDFFGAPIVRFGLAQPEADATMASHNPAPQGDAPRSSRRRRKSPTGSM